MQHNAWCRAEDLESPKFKSLLFLLLVGCSRASHSASPDASVFPSREWQALLRKRELLNPAFNVDEPRDIMASEISQLQRDTDCLPDSEGSNIVKPTGRESRTVIARGREKADGELVVPGVERFSHPRGVSPRDLVCSTQCLESAMPPWARRHSLRRQRSCQEFLPRFKKEEKEEAYEGSLRSLVKGTRIECPVISSSSRIFQCSLCLPIYLRRPDLLQLHLCAQRLCLVLPGRQIQWQVALLHGQRL
ncbi:PREDICTED: uncharacterized protein LOC107184123 isoform X1 [Myotis davidii]|uniref:uncharacterized protein LOC107184123 isoform X1 n=1 Tax=Myotis davidii TaxID=225400 RepID=UPI0007670DC0|nr:PREDICTED: uncharacterized protein LOC107184123 isoform X1 [Myotis davidii]